MAFYVVCYTKFLWSSQWVWEEEEVDRAVGSLYARNLGSVCRAACGTPGEMHRACSRRSLMFSVQEASSLLDMHYSSSTQLSIVESVMVHTPLVPSRAKLRHEPTVLESLRSSTVVSLSVVLRVSS